MIKLNRLLPVAIISTYLILAASSSDAFVWNQKHMDFNGCDTCHNLHGAAGFSLLAGIDTESTCLGCHGVAGPGPEAMIHDPSGAGMGNIGYVSCRECHDSMHDEDSFAGGDNIKMIGTDKDFEYSPPNTSFFSTLKASVREELPTSDPASPVYKSVVFKDRTTDFNRGVSNNGICQICHAAGPPVGPTDLNNHQWGDCTSCHMHNQGFKKLQCVDCHDVNFTVATTAPKVLDKTGASAAAIGSHLQAMTGESIVFPVASRDRDWTIQCIKCHTGHSGDINIPNNSDVGINYTMTGGIWLGGTDTIASPGSEAEICWGCHDQDGNGSLNDAGDISEWGTTTPDTNGAFPNFNYGTLDQPNWVGATWTSANFQYKTDLVQSTHAANATAGVAGVDTVSDIRCSYCHDVHDVNAATGDSMSGSPYLRGSWMGNPYREDGAPRWDTGGDQHAYAENQTFGAVPRGNRGPYTSHERTVDPPHDLYNFEMGGYWIDQNSGFPTRNANYDTAEEIAGLCELCHGGGGTGTKGDGTWEAGEIDNINQFAGNNWFGTNGHANSVLGGSGTASGNAFNVLTNSARGNALTSITDGSLGSRQGTTGSGGMGYFGWGASSRLWGVRNNDQDTWYDGDGDRGTGVFPMAENPLEWNDGRRAFSKTYGSGFEWGNWWVATDPVLTQDNSTTDNQYHQFTCSKCHNPHASRLPRLMITNCLDVRNNTWDNQTTFEGQEGYAGDSDWLVGGKDDDFDYNAAMVQAPGNQELAYSISAQNCHRAVDATTGWNAITPPASPAGIW